MPGRLSILAGGGRLVPEIITGALANGWQVRVISLVARNDLAQWNPVVCSLSKPLHIVMALRAFKSSHICMVGGLSVSDRQREGLFRFLGRKKLPTPSTGDTGLSRLIGALEFTTGAKVIGMHELVPDLIASRGRLAGPELNQQNLDYCRYALEKARQAGALDLGQAIISCGFRVIAAEDIAGTDALFERVTRYSEQGLTGDGRAPLVFAKAKKPDQPRTVDLPAIGPETIVKAKQAGISQLVVEAGNTIIIDRETVFERANELGISILALREE